MVQKGIIYMSVSLRLVILAVSVITAIFVLRKIRKSQFFINDTLFWLFFCLLLLVMCIFPQLPSFVSELIGFESPSNFIFMCIIFLLLIKIFLMDVRLSKTEGKFENLVQKYAIDHTSNKK